MDFVDDIKALAGRIPESLELLATEEATKNGLVMPFINALGYNVFDPSEVVPEFTADVGTKRGEKVDYAIMKDGEPILLFECKKAQADLNDNHASQLYRYFSVTPARIGVLTNGLLYRFFTDLDDPNKMDVKPFFEFDLSELDDNSITELNRFTKASFDLTGTLAAASELKYTREIKQIIAQQFQEPTEDFVRFFVSQVYSGRMTQQVREQFTLFTRRAFRQFISDRISNRLQSALASEVQEAAPVVVEPDLEDEDGIVTTDEEIEGYLTVKAILRDVVDVGRVVHRDTKSYMGILLDDNNRKPICRLRFNTSQRYLGLINEDKNEERVPLASLDEIYQHADKIRAAIAFYE